MLDEVFEVTRERFSLADENCYLLQGYFPRGYEAQAFLDSRQLETSVEPWESGSAMERFRDANTKTGERVTVSVQLPPDRKGAKRLSVYAVCAGKKIRWFTAQAKHLEKKKGKPYFYIEEEKADPSTKSLQVRGWTVFTEPVRIRAYDHQGKKIPCEIQRNSRVDVENMYSEFPVQGKCGFFLELTEVKTPVVYLVFYAAGKKSVYPVHMQRHMILKRKAGKYLARGSRYFQNYGGLALAGKVLNKMHAYKNRPVVYQKWIQKHLPSGEELKKQRETVFPVQPKISIVVPLYRTPEKYLRQLVDSVEAQTYSNWELCLSDGSGADSPLREVLKKLSDQDGRIRVVSHEEPLQISENTNAAIEAASGDFIAFADHDDVLTPNALFACVEALNQKPDSRIFYSDEDKMSMDGNKYFQPHFKPDFNIDLLCTVNYICHLFVVHREVIGQVGMLRREFDGAQDYDFILRCVEQVEREKICHLPQILYHWRSHENSTAENPESKRYAFEAGKRAIQAHYDRIGIPAEISMGEYPGLYRTKFLRDSDPLISIIIPNKDHVEDLRRCMDSIEEKSTYRNYEYIIVENNSEDPETFAYYKELEKNNPKVRVVYWEGIFNYSAINNFGVGYAKGEYLLLLNNDTEIINPDCLEELLGYCTRPDVGAVGARLYYEDDTIQHAGVVIGFGGIAGHCFVQQPRGYTGYCHRIICAQDYSAVTAACMMVKRKAFEDAGGLTEELKVAFNDIDFCMKLQKAGYLVVYNPYAELYHYESKSRGLEDTPEKIERFNREIAVFEKRWPEIMKNGDPYYNPNLTLESQDFSLKRI